MSGDDHFIKSDNDVMKLMRCPFCAGPADFTGGPGKGYHVKCQHCGAQSGWGDYGYKVSGQWNTRKVHPVEEEILHKALSGALGNLRHWREECGKLHAQIASLKWKVEIQNDQVTVSLDHYNALVRDHQKLTELVRDDER